MAGAGPADPTERVPPAAGQLADADKRYLLDLARQTLTWAVKDRAVPQPAESGLSGNLRRPESCFVTLWRKNSFVISSAGVFDRPRPLYQTVIRATVEAALNCREGDLRVTADGLKDVQIEISLLTEPKELAFASPDELLAKLRPGIDGVMLFTNSGCSTSLPSAWKVNPGKEAFLGNLCRLQGAAEDAWKSDSRNMKVRTFQAASFAEDAVGGRGAELKGAITKSSVATVLGGADPRAEKAPKLAPAAPGGGPGERPATVRFRNLSDSVVEAIRLGRAGAEGAAGLLVESLPPGQSTGYLTFPVGGLQLGCGVPVAGEYRQCGGKRDILIPLLTEDATIVIVNQGYKRERADQQLPLWPYPQKVTLHGQTQCDMGAVAALWVPQEPGEKLQAIGDALAQRLGHYLKLPALQVRRQGAAPKGYCVLSIGLGPEGWAEAAGYNDLVSGVYKVHPAILPQGYHLRITPEGVVLISPSARGLSYAAITLMQLARNGADGTKLPCVTIMDWPDLEVRSFVAGCPTYPLAHRRMAGRLAWEGKMSMICWWNQGRSYPYRSHPECGGKYTSQADYARMLREVRGWGVEAYPGHEIGIHTHSGNLPHIFLGDNETYFWAMKDLIDEDLELFRPRHVDLNMAEEHFCRTNILYPGRSFEQWRDAAATMMSHLRRRGIMATLSTEALYPNWAGGNAYPWTPGKGKKFPEGYFEFIATFPRELIFAPWFYWTKTTADALTKCDMERQAQTGQPVLPLAEGMNTGHHVAAVKLLKDKYPNILGVGGSCWGAALLVRNKFPRHPYYVENCVGPLWNLDAPERSERFRWEEEPGISNWECLLDADPPESVEEALKRLADPAWRVWTEAREQLVAAGLPAAPALLAAMSKADGELADRIEGSLSRNARDGRGGRRRGTLDTAKTLAFLADKNEAVRDMAAELVASCAEGGAATLRKRVKDATSGASCVRALGLILDAASARALIDVLAAADQPARNRAEAARILGLLRTAEAADPLRQVLRTGDDKELRKAALWALALLDCKQADGQIAELLASDDADTRYRSAIALVILNSPQTKKLADWLLADRHSLELAGWAMFKTWKMDEAKRAAEQAAKNHSDEVCRKRLGQLVQIFGGTAEGKIKY